jgi:hypothetical protein
MLHLQLCIFLSTKQQQTAIQAIAALASKAQFAAFCTAIYA